MMYLVAAAVAYGLVVLAMAKKPKPVNSDAAVKLAAMLWLNNAK